MTNKKSKNTFEENLIESRLTEEWFITFRMLRINLICNMFIIKHPEFDYTFPYKGNRGILSGYLHPSDEILKEADKLKETRSTDNQKAFDKMFDRIYIEGGWFDNIDIKDKDSFNKAYDYFCIMEMLCKKVSEQKTLKDKISHMHGCFFNGIDVIQKYFELIGYQTKAIEEKAKKQGSGKGQKMAQAERAKKLKEKIETFVNDFSKDVIDIDKGLFNKLLNETFEGAEEYPRHHNTIKTYKEIIEKDFKKKINLTRKK